MTSQMTLLDEIIASQKPSKASTPVSPTIVAAQVSPVCQCGSDDQWRPAGARSAPWKCFACQPPQSRSLRIDQRSASLAAGIEPDCDSDLSVTSLTETTGVYPFVHGFNLLLLQDRVAFVARSPSTQPCTGAHKVKKIVCHPDNFDAIMSMIEGRKPKHDHHFLFGGIEIKPDPYMERDRPTEKFVLPSGEVVELDGVHFEGPFIAYGPSDIDWLVYAGIVIEHRELVF